MRRFLVLLPVLLALGFAGCGHGDCIWVTGTLLKDGAKYTPPEGRKVKLYFCPVTEAAAPIPTAEIEMAHLDESDGSFTVPGREGYGIKPGKYRIAVIETMRRETADRVNKAIKPKRGERRIDNDKNFLESSFGETTSPFVRELKTSTTLTLDMAKPTE